MWASPWLRWVSSHAAPIVRKTNETPANPNPTMYQMLEVKPRSLRAGRGHHCEVVRSAPSRAHPQGATRADTGPPRTVHSSRGGPPSTGRSAPDRSGLGPPRPASRAAPARARRPSALVTARRTWAGDGSRRARVPVRDPSPGGERRPELMPGPSANAACASAGARVDRDFAVVWWGQVGSAAVAVSPRSRRTDRQPAAERHDREPAHRRRVDHPDERRLRVEVARQVGVRAGLQRDEQVAHPEPGEEPALGRRRDVVQAGCAGRRLDRGDVDVGGQVLPADRPVRVVVDPVADVRGQGSARRGGGCRRARPPGGRSRSAATDPLSRPPAAPATQASVARQISARWPVGERDALGVEAGLEGRRRRRPVGVGEARRRRSPRRPRPGPGPPPRRDASAARRAPRSRSRAPRSGPPSSGSTTSPRRAPRAPRGDRGSTSTAR